MASLIMQRASLKANLIIAALILAASTAAAQETLRVNKATLASALPRLRSGKPPVNLEIAGRVDLTQNEQWSVEALSFVGGGQIVIRNYNLSINVRGAMRTDSTGVAAFVSFPPEESKARRGRDGANGADGPPGRGGDRGGSGEAGADGLPSGNVTLRLGQSPDPVISFNLVGQAGGDGGRGGNGGTGGRGIDGDSAKSGAFNCLKPAGNGGPGGGGGQGGDGGAGGACGSGGVLNISGSFSPEKIYLVRPIAASPGQPGGGGRGGSGGPGGPGGRGGGFCSGGTAGPAGPSGAPGQPGRKLDPTACAAPDRRFAATERKKP